MSRVKNVNSKKIIPVRVIPLILILTVGLAARFSVGTLGHNFDFDSYRVIADLTTQGQNIYAHTTRYNYGPVMFNLVHGLDWLAGHKEFLFRQLLIGMLSVADVGIFWILLQQFGWLPAGVFFLNPISIIITGYHNQFDNLAIFIGLLAMLRFGDDFEKPLDARKYSALALLGLSLMTKHVFFAYPFWLAVKQRGLLAKLFILTIPIAIFFASFIPYWQEGHYGIIQNVFRYQAGTTGYLYSNWVPKRIQAVLDNWMFWFAAIAFFAFVSRKVGGIRSLLIYTGVLVSLAPTSSCQYFAIPLALLAVYFNWFSIFFTLVSTLMLVVAEFGVLDENWHGFDPDLVTIALSTTGLEVLLLAVIWIFWKPQILAAFQRCVKEVNVQLGLEK